MVTDFINEEVIDGYKVSPKRKQVFKRELEELEQFIKICDNHNLKYSLVDGSLLGCVRHKGFIPWDDDMDVGMPREDYEKFCLFAKEELKEPFCLDTFETNTQMISGFSRIRNNATTAFRSDVSTYSFPNQAGIFIDIFPYDNVPNNRFIRFIHSKRVYILKRLVNNSPLIEHTVQSSKLRSLFTKFVYIVCKFINPVKLHNKFIKVCKKYNNKKCKYCACLVYEYNENNFIETSYFNDLIKSKFEDINVSILKEYDRVLTNIYGDYHKFVIGTQQHEVSFFDPNKGFKEYKDDYLKYIKDFKDESF